MLQIGKYHTLEILRHVSPGLFLGDGDGNEVLLPNKYMPAHYEIGDKITVFVYLDFDEREVATTIKPPITLNGFAMLKVKDTNSVGAFLDWGLEKDLFVPFKEQMSKMRVGAYYLVHLYEDVETGRLVASQKVRKFLDNRELDIEEGAEVDIIVANDSELGVNVIVNQKYAGLIYHDEVFQELRSGDQLKGYLKKIRENNKLDISLQASGYQHVEPNANKILEEMRSHNGYLALHDGSDPQDIYEQLGMSKKTFKKAIGLLYKQKLIVMEEAGIRILVNG
jgi:predicted RNA-binding protein (virulence factor B family)